MNDPINTFVFAVIRDDFIDRALDTLYRYTDHPFRVVVVDQSKEGLVLPMNKVHLHIRAYRPLGYAKAMNTGIRMADTEFVTLCNDDIEFMDKRWWDGVVEAFKIEGDTVIGVNPMSPKEPGWGYGYPDHSDIEYIELLPYKKEYTKEDYDFLLAGDFSAVKPIPRTYPIRKTGVIDGIATWCTTFRMDGLLNIGGFDERFYPGGGEDYDLCGRAYSKMWRGERYRIVGTCSSWVYHHWSSTKDYLGDLPELDQSRYWNKLGELWPDGFDVWGEVGEGEERRPCVRDGNIHIEPL